MQYECILLYKDLLKNTFRWVLQHAFSCQQITYCHVAETSTVELETRETGHMCTIDCSGQLEMRTETLVQPSDTVWAQSI